MDDGRQELASQLAADRFDSTASTKRALLHLSRTFLARVTQDKKMEYTQHNDQASISRSNFRAEDGPTGGRSNALYEGVVIPLASLFAVALFVLGAMVLNHH
jgi:hypothetical protein